MKYFKETKTGVVYAYDADQLDAVNLIGILESDLRDAIDDESAESIQDALSEIPQVFFDVRDKLAGMTELTGAALDAHLNPVPVIQPPTTCTPAQGLVALYALKGITDSDISTAIDAIPDAVQRYTAQIGFSRATSWERDSVTMQTMAALLDLSDTDLDALLVFAAGVSV